MKVRRFIAPYEGAAEMAVIILVRGSVWFEFTPIPDGKYMITVKDEEHPVGLLRDLHSLGE